MAHPHLKSSQLLVIIPGSHLMPCIQLRNLILFFFAIGPPILTCGWSWPRKSQGHVQIDGHILGLHSIDMFVLNLRYVCFNVCGNQIFFSWDTENSALDLENWRSRLWPRPSNAIWYHISGSALVQVMACCLTAQSHYPNQCWLIISEVLWHSSEGNFTRDTSATKYSN